MESKWISTRHVLLTVEREDEKHQSENDILVTALIFPKCILHVASWETNFNFSAGKA